MKQIWFVLVLLSVVANVGTLLAQDLLPIVDPAARFEQVFSSEFWLESSAVAPDGSGDCNGRSSRATAATGM